MKKKLLMKIGSANSLPIIPIFNFHEIGNNNNEWRTPTIIFTH
jgi:hypothetical protein